MMEAETSLVARKLADTAACPCKGIASSSNQTISVLMSFMMRLV